MNTFSKLLLLSAITAGSLGARAQEAPVQGFVHEQSSADGYVWPTDQAVLDKLDKWQDQKFGVLFHWGLYSVPGIVESWSICSEDVDWIGRKVNLPYDEYKKWYFNLKDSLNPVDFNPEQWADIMDRAGMKYMVFTTKHHDGFCTFDSKLTDFTVAKGPFASNPRKNVAKEVFNAFRDKDFMIGCYFSKPDWHCEWFWNPYFATPNRRINYKKERHPDWWKNYQDFTAGQLGELLGGDYGKFDILWLDGGWITGDDIKLDSILADARGSRHPGLISVDRAIKGRNENYQTPERGIPATQLNYPWESCITLSNDWGWVPNAPFKSPTKVLGLLSEITAKGGCLLLGVGPTAQGLIQPEVEERLTVIGDWLGKNGEAIYSTRTTPFYNDGPVWFTANKDGKTLYAIYALPENEKLPATIEWTGNIPTGKMTLLDGKRKVSYSVKDGKVTVKLPKGLPDMPVALKFEAKK
ncbi:MAG TPA: alpha-L-fucosidase [Porphyromonadaceae bacterium]|jgi:alpha-L-fucosidase|nr:alpha-L-fucosidase [Paramuribaculum sp.]HAB41799.1 alpha-L-fucosidase [Porphyromonadaceae bacterium]